MKIAMVYETENIGEVHADILSEAQPKKKKEELVLLGRGLKAGSSLLSVGLWIKDVSYLRLAVYLFDIRIQHKQASFYAAVIMT